eukprot:jgi/Tetstr1/427517/TSEL_017643.t1
MAGRLRRPASSAVDEAFPEADTVELEADLSRLQLILRYTRSSEGLDAGHRMALIQGLAVGVEEEGQAALPGMLPELLELAEELCSDADVTVAAAAAAQLGPMVGALGARLGEGAGGVGPHLLQLACQLIQDSEDEEMVEAGEGALGAMLPVLPASCVAGLLQEGGLVHGLAAETDEMLRMAAARLVATLARYASGPGELEALLRGTFAALLRDDDFDVRKDAAASVSAIAAVAPEALRQGILLDFFQEAAKDGVWNVRMECASALPRMCQCLPPGARAPLRETMERLLEDRSRWVPPHPPFCLAAHSANGPVSHEARRQLGAYLEASPEAELTPTMLKHVQEMMSSGEMGEMEMQEAACAARDVPLVAARLGDGWGGTLGPALRALAACPKPPVRTALASALHLLAQLPEDGGGGKDELADIFLTLMKDDSQTASDPPPPLSPPPAMARPFLWRGMGRLHLLSAECWPPVLEQLPPIVAQDGENCSNWRTRLLLCQALLPIAESAEPAAVAVHLLPCALQLCRDPVAAVRTDAAQQAGAMMALLGTSGGTAGEEMPPQLLDELRSMATEGNHASRQIFADVCGAVLGGRGASDATTAHLLPPLLQLVGDGVPVVRIRLAKALRLIDQCGALPAVHAKEVHAALQQLQADSDADVKEAASEGSAVPA